MSNTAKNVANTSKEMIDEGVDTAHNVVAKTASAAQEAIDTTKRYAAETEKTIHGGLNQIREAVPATLSRAAHQAEDLARSGIEKARAAGNSVKEQAQRAGDSTVSYVREEPTKALLMAVAAGAFATLLIGWATRSNHRSND